MQAIRTRVARLEREANLAANPGMKVLVFTNSESTDEVTDLLLANCIQADDPRHEVTVVRTLIEIRDGSIAPPREPARIAYLQPR